MSSYLEYRYCKQQRKSILLTFIKSLLTNSIISLWKMNVLTNRNVLSHWDFIAFHSHRCSLTWIQIDRVKKNAANYDRIACQFTRKFNDCRLLFIAFPVYWFCAVHSEKEDNTEYNSLLSFYFHTCQFLWTFIQDIGNY